MKQEIQTKKQDLKEDTIMSENTEKKITEVEVFSLIREAIAGTANEAVIEEYLTKKEEQAAKRREKDAERRAQKRIEGDELQAEIAALITAEPQTATDLVVAYEAAHGTTLTSQKVIAKVKNLVEGGTVAKVEVKTPTGKRVAYVLA